jgi:hypothetical protein
LGYLVESGSVWFGRVNNKDPTSHHFCFLDALRHSPYDYQFPVALRTQSRTILTNMRPFTLLERADATSTKAAVDNVGFMMKSPIFLHGFSAPDSQWMLGQ